MTPAQSDLQRHPARGGGDGLESPDAPAILRGQKNHQGAIVTQVDPTSAAADAGLKEGDVIMEINKQPVKSADDAVKLTSNAKDKVTLLHVWSNDGSRWISHYLVVDEGKAG